MSTKSEIEAPDPRIYVFNPISHHFVKKSGAVWLRLVKAGMAEDPELIRGLQDKALARKKVADLKTEEKKTSAPKKAAPKTKAVRVARKHVESNRSELDDLESDAVVEQIRKLKLTRAALASDARSSSDSESDEPEPVSRKLASRPGLLRRASSAQSETLGQTHSTSPPAGGLDGSPKPRKPRPSSLPGPLSDRIRLKSQPIPIPSAVDRRAALRQSLAQPLDSDED